MYFYIVERTGRKNKYLLNYIFVFFSVKQNENWMRHGYPAAMGHGTPVTILKRGPSGASQLDTQVKVLFQSKFI